MFEANEYIAACNKCNVSTGILYTKTDYVFGFGNIEHDALHGLNGCGEIKPDNAGQAFTSIYNRETKEMERTSGYYWTSKCDSNHWPLKDVKHTHFANHS